MNTPTSNQMMLSPELTFVATSPVYCQRAERCISSPQSFGYIPIGCQYQFINVAGRPLEVCQPCWQHYQKKTNSAWVPTAVNPARTEGASLQRVPGPYAPPTPNAILCPQVPDTEGIRDLNSEAQRQAAPPLPRAVLPERHQYLEPAAFNSLLSPREYVQSMATVPRGYTPSHAFYTQETSRRAAQAYASTRPEEISIRFAVHHVEEGKSGSRLLWNLEDNHTMPAKSTAPQIKAELFNLMRTRLLRCSKGFLLKITDFELVGKDSTRYDRFPPDTPIFYNQCFGSPRGKGKGAQPAFQKGRSFDVRLLLSQEVYMDVLLHVERSTHKPPLPASRIPDTAKTQPTTGAITLKVPVVGVHDDGRRTTRKRTEREMTTTTLRAGCFVNVGHYVQTPVLDFAELVETKYRMEIDWLRDGCMGQIHVDERPESALGHAGISKTSHPAFMVLFEQHDTTAMREDNRFPTGVRTPVAVKRRYLRGTAAGTAGDDPEDGTPLGPITRTAKPEEELFLARELTNIVWADHLLRMVYSEIHIAQSRAEPHHDICTTVWPSVRFVKAGLFKVASSQPTPKRKENSRRELTYLVEELIKTDDTDDGKFKRYVHNASASPVLVLGRNGDIASFLTFTQHLQYDRTGGSIYVSDYQGAGELLTDPQIMTTP
ncbi:hypothetical protein CALCODRAFT_505414 [Calocera cornea HHB12733]|uniref:Alpha-type protein kinase domain-containing protein n=1 Tax=Calocera cornea HHB12733 TaxID=1353952 RepID=A0A165K3T4_9BASI|nr:hypothetical protein CALCODRAFT_505414 [Calocera cornea HHB12733]